MATLSAGSSVALNTDNLCPDGLAISPYILNGSASVSGGPGAKITYYYGHNYTYTGFVGIFPTEIDAIANRIVATQNGLAAFTLTGVSFDININFFLSPDWVDVQTTPSALLAGNDVITGSNLGDHINAYDGGDKVNGRNGDDWIDGGSGNDYIDGGVGADQMFGGDDDDIYLIDNLGDVVSENTDEGIDEVRSASLLSGLIANVENYTYSGKLAWTFTGDGAGNRLTGSAGNDVLDGGAGNDTLLGNGGKDTLVGQLGDDWLDGGIGNDAMNGGAGNDTYVISAAGDVINEEDNDDVADLVRSIISVDLALLAGGLIEHATLLGTAALKATGNAVGNVLTGNDAANVLDGRTGADTLIGNKGADTYIVDDAGDKVFETIAGAAGGSDLVKSSVDFKLGVNVEKLTLTGDDDIDAIGNTLANTLTGNAGANRLDGMAGNDIMKGGAGDDTYVVASAGDIVSETVLNSKGGGFDTVESLVTYSLAARPNIEQLILNGTANINGTGNALNNEITGNSGANTLNGAAGNDTLIGLAGNDILTGGAGNDLMVGGDGADKLNGGAGRDRFDYDHLSEAGDTITAFTLGPVGDVLDLADVLDEIGYLGSDAVGDGYVVFGLVGKNTVVSIDGDGAGLGGATPLATLVNVTLTGANLDNYMV